MNEAGNIFAPANGYDFIPLERTFHELSKYARESDDADIGQAFHIGQRLQWSDLIKEFRVILLAEAGSGKTAEIRSLARNLRGEGKAAFFLRLENIPTDFDIAFEVGSPEEFKQWLAGEDEGWLLLDSVDEARLRNPRDFELAIRKIGLLIGNAKERAHIVVTGRTTAWRPKTDLAHCLTHLPYTPPVSAAQAPGESDDDEADDRVQTETRREDHDAPGFKIVTLDNLTPEQVAIFIAARGVKESKAFLDAVERADAWSFTARPQDLEELADFWLDKGRIGGRLELMLNSIERRLDERDQSRAETRPLAIERVREGARLLAAATTLTKNPAIRIPDGADNSKGIAVKSVLPDWDDTEQAILLSRPIFDEAIYGAVRFHHRSVREYLTAEWFAQLLKRETSRRSIEALFFREQYGVTIVTPTLRPILPWLAILDDKIRDRVQRIAPEIAFEGGDPSQLPLDDRRRILRDVCEQIAEGAAHGSAQDYAAVQRFVSADLSAEVRVLVQKYSSNDELVAFLLRMVWLGQLRDALPEVMDIALTPSAEHYKRMTAFKALQAIGSEGDRRKARENFLAEAPALDRELLAELIADVVADSDTVTWLLACLNKAQAKKEFSVDRLADHLARFVDGAPLSMLPALVEGFDALMGQPPVIQRRLNEISQKFEWLIASAAKAAERLALAHHPATLQPSSLGIMRKLSGARGYGSTELSASKSDLATVVPAWPDLNRALFWFEVEQTRTGLDNKGQRIIDWWRASIFERLWQFGEHDFDYVAEQIAQQIEPDDKLVALSLAFDIYRNADRPRPWREKLKKIAAADERLSNRLRFFLNPPAQPEPRRWKDQERRWKKRDETRQAKRAQHHAKWKAHLAALQNRWIELSSCFPGVDDVMVIGIDLTKRDA